MICESSHCKSLQHTATHCNTQQLVSHMTHMSHVAHTHTWVMAHVQVLSVAHCSTLQHAVTRCNTLQHAATRCNTLQHAPAHSFRNTCNTLHHTRRVGNETQLKNLVDADCNALQHTATHCNTSYRPVEDYTKLQNHDDVHCNAPQHTATHRNTLHHIIWASGGRDTMQTCW